MMRAEDEAVIDARTAAIRNILPIGSAADDP